MEIYTRALFKMGSKKEMGKKYFTMEIAMRGSTTKIG